MSVKLKVCTFNLRTPVKDDGVNYLPNRKERILECIANENPDIIGFQEAAVYTADWLREVLDGYMVVGCGRGLRSRQDPQRRGFADRLPQKRL